MRKFMRKTFSIAPTTVAATLKCLNWRGALSDGVPPGWSAFKLKTRGVIQSIGVCIQLATYSTNRIR